MDSCALHQGDRHIQERLEKRREDRTQRQDCRFCWHSIPSPYTARSQREALRPQMTKLYLHFKTYSDFSECKQYICFAAISFIIWNIYLCHNHNKATAAFKVQLKDRCLHEYPLGLNMSHCHVTLLSTQILNPVISSPLFREVQLRRINEDHSTEESS